jgi:hypothetical protein
MRIDVRYRLFESKLTAVITARIQENVCGAGGSRPVLSRRIGRASTRSSERSPASRTRIPEAPAQPNPVSGPLLLPRLAALRSLPILVTGIFSARRPETKGGGPGSLYFFLIARSIFSFQIGGAPPFCRGRDPPSLGHACFPVVRLWKRLTTDSTASSRSSTRPNWSSGSEAPRDHRLVSGDRSGSSSLGRQQLLRRRRQLPSRGSSSGWLGSSATLEINPAQHSRKASSKRRPRASGRSRRSEREQVGDARSTCVYDVARSVPSLSAAQPTLLTPRQEPDRQGRASCV